jgi:ABC-type transporter Mla subunit MlaD
MAVSVEEILEKIEDMIDKAWSMPLSGGKCLVEADTLRDLLDDIRGNLPSEIRQAKAIVADRADIINTARQEAESIIRSAEERQRSMVSREEIVLQAQAKANEVLTKTQKRTKEMRKSAQDFTENLLKKTEETLAAQLVEIRQAKQAVRTPAQKLMYEENTEE